MLCTLVIKWKSRKSPWQVCFHLGHKAARSSIFPEDDLPYVVWIHKSNNNFYSQLLKIVSSFILSNTIERPCWWRFWTWKHIPSSSFQPPFSLLFPPSFVYSLCTPDIGWLVEAYVCKNGWLQHLQSLHKVDFINHYLCIRFVYSCERKRARGWNGNEGRSIHF